MPRFRVHLVNTISTAVEVEAADEIEAYDKAFDAMPSSDVMFLNHTHPDMSDWEVAEDFDGNDEIYLLED